MTDYVDLVESLFAAYGREANEAQIKSYSTVFRTGNIQAISKAIVEATRGACPTLPTAAQILKLSQEIAQYDSKAGERSQIEHNKVCGQYATMARKERWTRPQTDQLIKLCDRAFDQHSKTWTCSREGLSEQVAYLVDEVEQYRQQCSLAERDNAEPPDESMTSWGWALPQPGERDWDPNKETLWECVHRNRKNEQDIR